MNSNYNADTNSVYLAGGVAGTLDGLESGAGFGISYVLVWSMSNNSVKLLVQMGGYTNDNLAVGVDYNDESGLLIVSA